MCMKCHTASIDQDYRSEKNKHSTNPMKPMIQELMTETKQSLEKESLRSKSLNYHKRILAQIVKL